jgi:hypothetical protein
VFVFGGRAKGREGERKGEELGKEMMMMITCVVIMLPDRVTELHILILDLLFYLQSVSVSEWIVVVGMKSNKMPSNE